MTDLQRPNSPGVPTLNVAASHDADTLVLAMSGSAEVRDSTPLAELLMHYHAEAKRVGAKQVDVDVRTVDFMNSSALNAFVRWFAEMKNRNESYKVRFLSDPSKRWQRGSLSALATFATGNVTVETPVR